MKRVRLKNLAQINSRQLPEETEPDRAFRYVDIESVGQGRLVAPPELMTFGHAPSRARRLVASGDTIVSTVRTYLRAVWHIESDADDLVVSTGLAVISPRDQVDPSFLGWALQSNAFVNDVVARSVGVSYPAINPSALGDISISVPLLQQQRAVADYLDRETARVDALIDMKQRALGLLAEKRRVLITGAVTRGLDSRVALRDSGIPWLGMMPAHWKLKRLKHVGRAIIGLTFDPADVVSDGSGVLVLRASNVHGQRVVLDDNLFVLMDIPETLRTISGDILICSRSGSRSLIGKNAMIDQASAGLTFGAFMTVFRSHDNEYLFYAFNSPLFEHQAGAFSTATINQLTIDALNNMKVPIPPPLEQRAIVASLREGTSRLDRIVGATAGTIALLKERRQALITAAVTGQISIPDAA